MSDDTQKITSRDAVQILCAIEEDGRIINAPATRMTEENEKFVEPTVIKDLIASEKLPPGITLNSFGSTKVSEKIKIRGGAETVVITKPILEELGGEDEPISLVNIHLLELLAAQQGERI